MGDGVPNQYKEEKSMQEKKPTALNTFAILSLSLVSMAITVVTPAMATFAAVFPGQNITFISTLPTLFIVIATFISGAIMGKSVKYRTLAILGNTVALIGGIAPAIIGTPDNFALILVCRGIFGFGLGLMSPLGNALIIGLYEGQKRASILGYGTLCMNFGGIVCQMLGGALAGMDWKMTFWGHGFLIIAVLMSFFIPEPPKVEMPQGAADGPKPKPGIATIGGAVLLVIFNIVNYPNMMNMSILFEQRNAGGAVAAATALSLYTVAGCIAGLIFGQLFKIAQRWCFLIGYIICTVGSVCIYFGTTNIIMTLGLCLIGFGFSIIMPAIMAWLGMTTHPAAIASATAIVLAAMNIAGFISSFYVSLLQGIFGMEGYVLGGVLCAVVVFAATAVIFLFVNPFKNVPAGPGPAPTE